MWLMVDSSGTPARSRLGAVCAAICCALALAACGSSTKLTSVGASVSTSLVKYSECMRSHGVPDFPDPSTSQGPNAFGIDGYNFDIPANLNSHSPAYESADKNCRNGIGGDRGGPARNPAHAAKARQAALVHAVCMRQHGVPNFPDPTVTGSAQGITVRSGATGIDPRSAAFQQAQKICAPS
jgi:hypothetical protein